MLMCKAQTAIIRNGRAIPGGTPFGIKESERAVMDARGFKVYEVADSVSPKADNVNSTPESKTVGNTGNKPGTTAGTTVKTPKAGTSSTAIKVSK